MNKFIILAATAAMLLASCSKQDAIEGVNYSLDNTMKVTAMIDGATTKASAVVTDQANLGSFKLYAYNDGVAVFEDLTFTKPTTAGDPWTHDNIYYWATGTYDFFGVAQDNAASNAISKVKITKDGITIGTASDPYVITTDGATNRPYWNGTAYEGGIYDGNVASVSQPDPIIAYETATRNDQNSGTAVTKINFYHALSRIRMQLSSYDAKTSKLKLVVTGYEFRQVGVKGYMSAVKSTDAAKNPTWTILNGSVGSDTDGTGMVRENSIARPSAFDSSWTGTSKSLIPTDSWCNVIPGQVAVAMVCKCSFYDANNKWVADRYLTCGDATVMNAGGTITAYKPGYQYTYKVAVTSDGGDDTDKPKNPGLDDPNHDGPDEPLDNLTIKIVEVEVAAWQNVDGGTATFTGK